MAYETTKELLLTTALHECLEEKEQVEQLFALEGADSSEYIGSKIEYYDQLSFQIESIGAVLESMKGHSCNKKVKMSIVSGSGTRNFETRLKS